MDDYGGMFEKINDYLFDSLVRGSENPKPFHHKFLIHSWSKLDQQRKEQPDFCDVVIKCGDDNFHAHQCMLASVSKYFEGLFFTPLQAQSRIATADLSEFRPDSISWLLEMIYNTPGLKREEFKHANTMELIQLADFLGVESILTEMINAVRRSLSFSNCYVWYEFADRYNISKLRILSLIFMGANFEQLALQPDFQNFSLPMLRTLLSCNLVLCYPLSVVIKAIISWCHRKPEDAKSCFGELLQHVLGRYPFSDEIYDDLVACPIVSGDLSFMAILSSWKSCILPRMFSETDALFNNSCIVFQNNNGFEDSTKAYDLSSSVIELKHLNPDLFGGEIIECQRDTSIRLVVFFVWRCQLYFVILSQLYVEGGMMHFLRYNQCLQEWEPVQKLSMLTIVGTTCFNEQFSVDCKGDLLYVFLTKKSAGPFVIQIDLQNFEVKREPVLCHAPGYLPLLSEYESFIECVDFHELLNIELVQPPGIEKTALECNIRNLSGMNTWKCVQCDGSVFSFIEDSCARVFRVFQLNRAKKIWEGYTSMELIGSLVYVTYVNGKIFLLFKDNAGSGFMMSLKLTNKMWSAPVNVNGALTYKSVFTMPSHIVI